MNKTMRNACLHAPAGSKYFALIELIEIICHSIAIRSIPVYVCTPYRFFQNIRFSSKYPILRDFCIQYMHMIGENCRAKYVYLKSRGKVRKDTSAGRKPCNSCGVSGKLFYYYLDA